MNIKANNTVVITDGWYRNLSEAYGGPMFSGVELQGGYFDRAVAGLGSRYECLALADIEEPAEADTAAMAAGYTHKADQTYTAVFDS